MRVWIKSKEILWVLLAIGVAALVFVLLYVTRSDVSKAPAAERAPLVEYIVVKPQDQRIAIEANGVVQSNVDVTLRPEVSGRVVSQSPNLVIGGIVKEGEELLQIDPRDYENIVEQEKAALERAQFDLKVEQGRQVVAKREWEQLTPTITKHELSEELALRKPHLKEKQAALQAAQSRLEKAELDLKRTTIISPLNAIVINEAAEVGELLNTQSVVADLVSTNEFRVQVSVPVSKLSWIKIPSAKSQESSEVMVYQNLGNGKRVGYEGRILRLLGSLDPSGRMARLLILVDDPLGLENSQRAQHPLLIGSYVEVEIMGPIEEMVYVIPREALRENNKVWLIGKNNELLIKEVSIVARNQGNIVIDEGLSPEDHVVTSYISLPIPGMKLRTE